MQELRNHGVNGGVFRSVGFFLFVVGCIFFISVTQAGAAEPEGKASDEYLIGVGDVLEINVWNEEDLSKDEVFVRLDGRISLPMIGDAVAKDLSPEGLGAALEEKFGKFITEPNVSVILKESHSKTYYIVGQIAKPGQVPINQPISIMQGIARSGGFLEWAKKSKIIVVRKGENGDKYLSFDYDAFITGENPGQNILIAPGDTIIVP
jgi:polysaccharide export outer membrane protein